MCHTIDGSLRAVEAEIAAAFERQRLCVQWAELHRRNITRLLDALKKLSPKLEKMLLKKIPLHHAIMRAAQSVNPAAAFSCYELEERLLSITTPTEWRSSFTKEALCGLLPLIRDWITGFGPSRVVTAGRGAQNDTVGSAALKQQRGLFYLAEGLSVYPEVFAEKLHRPLLRAILVTLENIADDMHGPSASATGNIDDGEATQRMHVASIAARLRQAAGL